MKMIKYEDNVEGFFKFANKTTNAVDTMYLPTENRVKKVIEVYTTGKQNKYILQTLNKVLHSVQYHQILSTSVGFGILKHLNKYIRRIL